MGNITGLIVAILVAILGFFGWQSLDSRIGDIQAQVAARESDAGTATQLLQRIEAVEAAGSSQPEVDLTPLLDRIGALESANPADLNRSDGAPSEALQQRLAALEQEMGSIGRDFGEEALGPLVARMEALESALGAWGETLNASVEDQMNALNARLDSVESGVPDLSAFDQRLDTLDDSLAKITADFAGVEPNRLVARLAAVESTVGTQSSAAGETEALSQRLDRLESTVGGIQSTIQAEALAPLSARVEAIEAAVAAIEPGIGQQSLVPLMQRIQEVEKAVGGAIASAGAATDENLIAGGFEFVDSEIVYFGYDSASLSDEGLAGLKRFSEQITPTSKIVIRGYADSRGSNIYNQNLALRRALNTEKVLVGELRARDIFRNQIIALESAGEESQLVETGDNVENAKNRAVKITLYE